jgi:hypothetical protein
MDAVQRVSKDTDVVVSAELEELIGFMEAVTIHNQDTHTSTSSLFCLSIKILNNSSSVYSFEDIAIFSIQHLKVYK